MSVTREQLLRIMPQARSRVDGCLDTVNAAMSEFGIDAPLCQAAFLAQIAHESGQLATAEENLFYSADGLANTWPARYGKKINGLYQLGPTKRILPNSLALSLQRKPEAIANNVYAGRMGNGDEASGDGWRYRGAGWIQLTGKENHLAVSLYFDIPLEQVGDWLRTPAGAARSAAWFWKVNGCNDYAARGNFDGVSDLINLGRKTAPNGDAIGYADRFAIYNKAKEVLL